MLAEPNFQYFVHFLCLLCTYTFMHIYSIFIRKQSTSMRWGQRYKCIKCFATKRKRKGKLSITVSKWEWLNIYPYVSVPHIGILYHYADVIMGPIASQITSLMIVYSIVYSDADQRKHQSSASLAFVWGIHRDRWIPRTKGQLRGKCFHLMTSSCDESAL